MTLHELLERGGERVVEHASLGLRTTYRVGGSVRALVTLSTRGDFDELAPAIATSELALVVLGNGSNLLVADGEHEMLALHLGEGFCDIGWTHEDATVVVRAGAGLDLPVAARRLASEGIVGFEWAVGVPGTFGGAVAMNAGGHGSNLAASLIEADTWSHATTRTWTNEELDFGYRSSALGPGDVVTDVTLRLGLGDPHEAKEQIREIVRWRREHQPGGANAGSVFQNPPGASAGQLIEAAGCKGLRVGSAVVSEKHANFIQVDAGGRANDVYELLIEVRARVLASSGVELTSEHRFVGFGAA